MDSMRELYITTEVKHVAEIFRDVSLQDKTTGAHTESISTGPEVMRFHCPIIYRLTPLWRWTIGVGCGNVV